MKTDGMVILSGLSGTGKSKLVTEYANVLKISSGDNGPRSQVRFVSVRPFWADDSDLLGYADTVNNIYRPGDSGLIDTLIDAQDNQDDLFIIVFDEMNLARVEHYFSQFLSVLEMDSGLRTLTLYNPQLEARLYNSEKYPSSISIGENVLFVGTVNTDESTYQFSDKVLDRSNVMTLQMLPFGSITEEVTTSLAKGQTETVKLGDYQKMKKINPDARMSQNDKNMFWDIHQALNEMDSNVGIGWRIVKQIDKYLMNLPQDVDWFDRRQAIDYQVAQRVLTKVRGSEEQLTPLVGTISFDGTYKEGKLGEIFSKNAASSDFLVSRKILQKKAKELKLYGFTV
ncbi:ATPase [Weissella cibaria]|nr:ATPase [Weissella cibaria]